MSTGTQPAQRDGGRVGVDAEGDVAAGADLERDAAAHDLVQHPGSSTRADAVAEPVGAAARSRQAPRRASGAAAARRRAGRSQPGAPGDLEGRGEVVGAPAPLVVGQPEADHARRRRRTGRPAGPGCARPAGAGSGWPRRPPPTPMPVAAEASRAASSTSSSDGGDAAEERRVRRRVDLDLQPARPLGGVVLGRLAHQPAHVVLVAHAPTGPRRRAAGTGTSRARRWRAAAAATRWSRPSGSRIACSVGELDAASQAASSR